MVSLTCIYGVLHLIHLCFFCNSSIYKNKLFERLRPKNFYVILLKLMLICLFFFYIEFERGLKTNCRLKFKTKKNMSLVCSES